MGAFDYDVIVIGSGFGGSVTALRLAEKGYRVGVLEAGMRFTDESLPDTNWDLKKYMWAPKLGLKGMQKITLLHDVMVLSGAGVGGGSLVYANTLYEPMQPFYDDPQWRHITDWRTELAPYYDQAKRMLGVVENPAMTPADEVMKSVATDMGRGHTFHLTPVGVFFGDNPGETVDDPYFGGAGPARAGCIQCGNCMVGCKHNAKNRLDKNYLYLAERLGAEVHAETTVTALRPLSRGGWAIDTVATGSWRRRPDRVFTAEHVVLAAGALGTQKILHKMRDSGVLTRLSARLGELTRTNSEAILGAISKRKDVDYSQGVAITSSWHPDEDTHIEPVRYGPRNNAMKLLSTAMTDPVPGEKRWKTWVKTVAKNPGQLKVLLTKKWSEQTIIVLVMQSLDNSLEIFGKKTRTGYRLSSRQGHGAPNPTTIPVGNEATRRVAEKIDGVPGGGVNEIADIPMTAHILGGCVIGDSPETGVIDPYHRVYGYDGLHVVDGAAVSANLGVNPSLTITAQAERAMSLWPNKGEADPRPPVGAAYQRIPPVAPRTPSPSMQAMLEAVLRGARDDAIEGVEVVTRAALAATAVDVLGADGLVLGTPANIGYMSGALKHFFDTVYYPCLEETVGRPYGAYIHGNSDTAGALRGIETIVTGLRWRAAREPVVVIGEPSKDDLDACWELGATVAAGLMND